MRLAFDTKTQETVVIKYYKKINNEKYDSKSRALIQREYTLLTKFEHPGVVKCLGYGQSTISGEAGPAVEIYFILLEYLPGGTLFEFLNKAEITEGLACFIFEELVKVVEHINTKGFAHLDIKLENIMIDKDGKFKFIDFGFASELMGEHGDGKLSAWVGTHTYKAPEINEMKPYPGFTADLFALGVVLFALVGKVFPFEAATPQDSLYQKITQDKYEEYWQLIGKALGEGTHFPISLQNLLNGLFAYNTVSRITIPEILKHEWIVKTPKPIEADVRKAIKKLCNLP